MTKTASLSFRIDPAVKAAVEKAAEEDGRSIASYVERALADHLRAKGYLKEAKAARR